MIVKMGNEISSFTLYDMESLYEAWKRHKELLHRCPHYGLANWLQLHAFYNGLSNAMRTFIDVVVGGSLMGKRIKDVYELLGEMTANA